MSVAFTVYKTCNSCSFKYDLYDRAKLNSTRRKNGNKLIRHDFCNKPKCQKQK